MSLRLGPKLPSCPPPQWLLNGTYGLWFEKTPSKRTFNASSLSLDTSSYDASSVCRVKVPRISLVIVGLSTWTMVPAYECARLVPRPGVGSARSDALFAHGPRSPSVSSRSREIRTYAFVPALTFQSNRALASIRLVGSRAL